MQPQLLGRKRRFTGLVPDGPEPHAASRGHSLAPRGVFRCEEPGGGTCLHGATRTHLRPLRSFACPACSGGLPTHSPWLWTEATALYTVPTVVVVAGRGPSGSTQSLQGRRMGQVCVKKASPAILPTAKAPERPPQEPRLLGGLSAQSQPPCCSLGLKSNREQQRCGREPPAPRGAWSSAESAVCRVCCGPDRPCLSLWAPKAAHGVQRVIARPPESRMGGCVCVADGQHS